MPTLTKLYTLKEVSQHNTKDDCWIIVDGKIYDVTSYLDEHPGGDDVLLDATGRDSTNDFEDAGHSKSARELMQEYCIGELDSTPVIADFEIFSKNQSTGLTHKIVDITMQYWIVPVAIAGISVVAGLLYMRKK